MKTFTIEKKTFALIFIALMLASATLMVLPSKPIQLVEAQAVLPAGVTPTNNQTGYSQALPAGVTPDQSFDTLSRIAFSPNPIGLGQYLLVNVWTEPPVHQSRCYTGYTVTMTKPDETKVTVGPFNSFFADTTGYFTYAPDQLGNWSIQFNFPGGYFPPGNYTSQASASVNTIYSFTQSAYYKPSVSPVETFIVQSQPVASWPSSTLPTDYWTRPAQPDNREWWPILGNYPATGVCGAPGSIGGVATGGSADWPVETNTYMSNYNFIPYVQAPKTAHIVWLTQGVISGLVGGSTGQNSLAGGQLGAGTIGTGAPGSALTGGGNPTIVYDGRCYQTYSKPGVGTTTQTYWKCFDLRTGQLFWERPLASGETAPTVISYVYSPPIVAAGGIGVPGSEAREPLQLTPCLMSIGTRLVKYDPWTGAVLVNGITRLANNFTGMTGTFYKDPYVLSVQSIGSGNYRLLNWTTAPVTDNFTTRIISNITWPFSSLGTCDFESGIAVSTVGITPTTSGVAYGLNIMAASLTTGNLLWNITTNPNDSTLGLYSGSTAVADHGKFAARLNDGHWHCWDLLTGKELWTSELSSYPWGIFGDYSVSSAYGMIIYGQYDGVTAYNWTNGKIVWNYIYEATYPLETQFGDAYPFYQWPIQIADGVVFASNTVHSPPQPLTRGWKLHAINATTGIDLWNITGAWDMGAVADGYFTGSNGYDGFTYVFGKGQSSMTVLAPQTAISSGTGIIISGTVLDQSPSQPGTPCVSARSMATEMEYLHMQKPINGLSGNITVIGVPVSIDAVDPNGNLIHIAMVNSDGKGSFGYTWNPPTVPGQYKIIATFAGDDSYGSSSAESYATVVSPIATPTSQPLANQPPTEMYFAISTAAIIIAIAIVGAVLVSMLKKRS